MQWHLVLAFGLAAAIVALLPEQNYEKEHWKVEERMRIIMRKSIGKHEEESMRMSMSKCMVLGLSKKMGMSMRKDYNKED